MFKFILPVAAIGAFLAIAQRTPAPAARMDVDAHSGHSVIHILSANEDGEAVGESVTPALIAFRVEAGHVDGAAILECEQTTETRTEKDVSYHVVILQCGDTKLAVSGLDLTVKK